MTLRVEGINGRQRVFYGDDTAPDQWCPIAPNELHVWAFLRESRSPNPEHNVRVFFCQLCLTEVEKRF